MRVGRQALLVLGSRAGVVVEVGGLAERSPAVGGAARPGRRCSRGAGRRRRSGCRGSRTRRARPRPVQRDARVDVGGQRAGTVGVDGDGVDRQQASAQPAGAAMRPDSGPEPVHSSLEPGLVGGAGRVVGVAAAEELEAGRAGRSSTRQRAGRVDACCSRGAACRRSGGHARRAGARLPGCPRWTSTVLARGQRVVSVPAVADPVAPTLVRRPRRVERGHGRARSVLMYALGLMACRRRRRRRRSAPDGRRAPTW